MQALHKGQLEDAAYLLRQLRQIDPVSKETRGLELELLIKSKKIAEASVLVTHLVRLYPDSGRILWLSGRVRYLEKQYTEAAKYFEESFRIHPHPMSRLWLARAWVQTGYLQKGGAVLREMVTSHPSAYKDLAWLEEREGDLEGAIKSYERYLQHFPNDSHAKDTVVRLKATALEPAKFLEEMQNMEQWGEVPPVQLYPIYIARLLEMGQSAKARKLVALASLPASQAVDTAWAAYRARAYDLAYELFRGHVQSNLNRFAFLNAFERAAEKCARLPEVITSYENLAADHKPLYGRIQRLRSKLRNFSE